MNRNTPWTEAETQTLIDLFPTHTTEHVAKILNRSIGSVYAAATRFGITKAPPTKLSKTAKIIEACKPDTGLTVGELGKAIGESNDFCNTIAHLLCRGRRLFKAGLFKHTRYFVTEESAKAWHTQAHAERDTTQAEAKRKKMDARNKARRIPREKECNAPRKPRPAPAPKVKPRPKPEPKVKVKAAPKPRAAPFKVPSTDKRSHIHITNRAKQPAIKAAPAAKIVWPEHVKVQVHPTPPSRFDFTPPPGWRGQITHDWMNRRLGGVENNARG